MPPFFVGDFTALEYEGGGAEGGSKEGAEGVAIETVGGKAATGHKHIPHNHNNLPTLTFAAGLVRRRVYRFEARPDS